MAPKKDKKDAKKGGDGPSAELTDKDLLEQALATLIENAGKLERNPRMAMPYRTLRSFSETRRAEIIADATLFLGSVDAAAGRGIDQLALDLESPQ
jgi:hypothetical protein